ncbi:hypothetical protein ABZ897_28795 [Nonomuraea sp. NPDC046802]|uniref:hypothetical protein n=1 Tax=Nonomuraea sp. NPDC046802 TaxID=3154919 RepID=UPI0033C401AF
MGVVASFKSVTEEQLVRARQDPLYAGILAREYPEGDHTPADSCLSVQRRSFYIERFSFELWEGLVLDAPVNVFLGESYIDLADEDDEDDEDYAEDREAMELEPDLIAELAGWLRGVRFEDVYEGQDQYGFIRKDFGEFRTFVLAVAERGEGALLRIA